MLPEPAKTAEDHNMGTIVDTNTVSDVFFRKDDVFISLYMNALLW